MKDRARQLGLSQGRLGHHLWLGLASRGSPKGDWGITCYCGLPAVALPEETGASPVTMACQLWLSQRRPGYHLLLWLASHDFPRGDRGITCDWGMPAVALPGETGASPATGTCQPWLSQGRLGHQLWLGLASRGSPRGDWGITCDWGLPAVALPGETGASAVIGACLAWLSKGRLGHHLGLGLAWQWRLFIRGGSFTTWASCSY